MMGTDMLYFAVARDGHDGGVQITASHNPKEYNGIKMVRREAFPLSGDEGIGDIRDMIVGNRLPPESARKGRVSQMEVLDDYVEARALVHRSLHHQAVQRRARRGKRDGGSRGPEAVRRAALPDDAAVLRHRRHLPQPRGESADRGEPPRHRGARQARRRRHRDRLGRRCRPRASSSTAPASSSPATS